MLVFVLTEYRRTRICLEVYISFFCGLSWFLYCLGTEVLESELEIYISFVCGLCWFATVLSTGPESELEINLCIYDNNRHLERFKAISSSCKRRTIE